MSKTKAVTPAATCQPENNNNPAPTDNPVRVRIGDGIKPWTHGPKLRIGDGIKPWSLDRGQGPASAR